MITNEPMHLSVHTCKVIYLLTLLVIRRVESNSDLYYVAVDGGDVVEYATVILSTKTVHPLSCEASQST